LEIPKVDPLLLEEVDWYVVTKDNIDKVMAELQKKGYETVIFGLTDKGYEILALNIAKIKQMTTQQKATIEAYDKYYKSQQQKLDVMEEEQDKKIREAEETNKKAKGKGLLGGVTDLFKGSKNK
jgi:hypothetical protein